MLDQLFAAASSACKSAKSFRRRERKDGAEPRRRRGNGVASPPKRSCSTIPPSAPGAMRLYRLDDGEKRRGALFATDMALAGSFAKSAGVARMVYVDVPASRLGELTPSRSRPGTLFVVPPAISAESKILEAESTASHIFNSVSKARWRVPDKANCQKIGALLPDDQTRIQFEQQSKRLLDKVDEAIAAQTTLERQSAFWRALCQARGKGGPRPDHHA